MRTKNVVINYIADLLPQFIITIIGFFKIKIFLEYLGQETLGIYQLFGQLLSYLSLAEIGLTAGVLATLYVYVAKKDNDKINAILSGAKKFFKWVFLTVISGGIILSIFIMFFVSKTTLDQNYIRLCFILFAISGAINYLVAPHTILFDAEQKRYVYNLPFQIVYIVRSILEIVFVLIFKDLVTILLLSIVVSIIQNILIIYLSKKNHENINLNTKPDYSFISNALNIVPHKIGSLIAFNTDIIVISKVLGVGQVVVYSSYMYICDTLKKNINYLGTAVLPSVGNLLVTEKEKAKNIFLEYNSLLFYIAIVICIPLNSFLTPFVSLWYGNDLIVSNITRFLFIAILFYNIIRDALGTFSNAAGVFKYTKKCVVIECIINLTLSIVLSHYLGILGILIGTIVSYVVGEYFLKYYYINKYIFDFTETKYHSDNIKYFLFFIIQILLFEYLFSFYTFSNLFIWFIYGILTFVVNLFFTTLYFKLINKFSFGNRILKIIKR